MTNPSVSRGSRWRDRFSKLFVNMRRAGLFAAGVLAAFLALLLFNLLNPAPAQLTKAEMEKSVASILASATPPAAFSAEVYQIIRPSLVLIQSEVKGQNGKNDSSLGSGVVIDDAGDILTSLHVVADSEGIKLTFPDGSESSAQTIVQQPEKDIAILRADTPPALLVPAVIGNPNLLRVGDEAYVVGNPLGFYASMSSGVISGFNRTFQPTSHNQKLEGLIQIDTAVNPGNSGGPLLNRYGEVVGIVTGIVNPTGQDVFIGIGFAMPIDQLGGAAGLPPY
jgi:S1-C subfamily serine protease